MDLSKVYELEQHGLATQLAALRFTLDHSGEKGRVLESYVGRLLRDALPLEYGITTGFIAFPPNGADSPVKLSTQLDFIIYDAVHGSPLVRLPTCDVVPLEAVFAYVEVKAQVKDIKDCAQRALAIREYTARHFHASIGGNQSRHIKVAATSVRSYVFAYEGPAKAAEHLQAATIELGGNAELSGLFINDQGYFRSHPRAKSEDPIEVDCLATQDKALAMFRHSILHDLARFDRWFDAHGRVGNDLATITAIYLDQYLPQERRLVPVSVPVAFSPVGGVYAG